MQSACALDALASHDPRMRDWTNIAEGLLEYRASDIGAKLHPLRVYSNLGPALRTSPELR